MMHKSLEALSELFDSIRHCLQRRPPGRDHEHLLSRLGEANRKSNQLLHDWQQQACQLAVVDRIGQVAVSSLNLDEMASRVLHEIRESMHAQVASLVLFDPLTGERVFERILQSGEGEPCPACIKQSRGIAGWVARTGRPLRVDHASQNLAFYPGVADTTEFSSHSIVCVPLSLGGRILGAIEVMNKLGSNGSAKNTEAAKFSVRDEKLLAGVAAYVSLAVENARLHAASRNQIAIESIHDTAVTLAHHINNPLQALLGTAEVLQMRMEEKDGEECPDIPAISHMAGVIVQQAIEIAEVLRLLQEASLLERTPYLGNQQMFDISDELQIRLARQKVGEMDSLSNLNPP